MSGDTERPASHRLAAIFIDRAVTRTLEHHPDLVEDVGRRIAREAHAMDRQLDRACRSVGCRVRSFFRGFRQR